MHLQIQRIVNCFVNQKMSIKEIANQENFSESRVKKILISEGVYKTKLVAKIKALREEGKTTDQIIKILGISRAVCNINSPYARVFYGLNENEGVSKNALRIRKCRQKKKGTFMTNIEKIISKGYQIKKGGLFLGVPQNEEGVIDKLNPYMFYFIKPNGEFSEPHTFLDEIFYITDDKIPTTRREIIKYLYSPTEEEWCLFENGHSLRTKKYLGSIKNKISLIKIDGITEGKLEDIKDEEEIEPFTVDGRAFIGTNKDNLYVVQISYVTGVDSYYTDIYYFEKYPFRKNIETARKIREVESRFRIKELHETFICKECQQEQHWLNVEGGLETKTHYLSEKYCGC